jgi:hypothetical protein
LQAPAADVAEVSCSLKMAEDLVGLRQLLPRQEAETVLLEE